MPRTGTPVKFCAALAAFLLSLSACGRGTTQSAPVIGVNQFMQHPLLDAAFKGMSDELNRLGVVGPTGSTLDVKNANGDQNVAQQINRQFLDRKVQMIVALGTPSAQSACKMTKSVPIVFGVITDPVAAGIADSIDHPGGNKTGTSDRWPYEAQVGLIRQIVPSAKRVGLIMNPAESNTAASLAFIRPLLKQAQLEAVEVPVANTSEVLAAAQSLVGRVDVLLVPGDNTVIAAMASVVKVANDRKIPLFVGDIASVEQGAVATYGNNYYEIGRATARLVQQVLAGRKSPGEIPVAVAAEADLVVNLKAAAAQGVTIPLALVSQAKRVIK
jgi:putative ABC transport system substrate-binding protein